MPDFRRYYLPNALVFITSVTHERQPYFSEPENRALFHHIKAAVQELHPYHLLAHVLMPDHFHWILRMEENSSNYSPVLKSLKWNFSFEYKKIHALNGAVQIWQPRFWDHVIRNEADLERHINYIHYNPVKHGLVQDPLEWADSSFRFWQERGVYPKDWGSASEPDNIAGLFME
jgi:putative transposase